MRTVRFHFIAGDSMVGTEEDACVAAAILANSLTRQGYEATAEGPIVTTYAPARRESEPDNILVVLDEEALHDEGLLGRLDRNSAVIVCSARPARILRHELGRFTAGVAAVDGSGIAMEEGSDPVVALLGGAARMVPFIDPDVLCATVWNYYDRSFPYAARAAMRTFDLGYMQAQQALG
jgi:hypothetical protein